jgi:triosephosphate isomerase (TIM)
LQEPILIINFKNYAEIQGERCLALARQVEEVARELCLEDSIAIAPPTPALALISSCVDKITVIAQHVDDANEGSTTGYVTAEMLKSFNIRGSLVNHSEHRLDLNTIKGILNRLKRLNMLSIVCANTPDEVKRLALLNPDYIAIEPPELIGTGNAVSKSKPEVIVKAVEALNSSSNSSNSSSSKIICGAGIVDASDVKAALRLGSKGILVASGVIKAKDWKAKVHELAEALIKVDSV